MSELNTVVILPIHKQRIRTVGLYSIKGELRISRYTPAVTIVAAESQYILGPITKRLPLRKVKKRYKAAYSIEILLN